MLRRWLVRLRFAGGNATELQSSESGLFPRFVLLVLFREPPEHNERHFPSIDSQVQLSGFRMMTARLRRSSVGPRRSSVGPRGTKPLSPPREEEEGRCGGGGSDLRRSEGLIHKLDLCLRTAQRCITKQTLEVLIKAKGRERLVLASK